MEELERIVAQIRQAWPEVRITLRGDSGFCREELMAWCEEHRVDYVLGLAKNERLKAEIAPELAASRGRLRRHGAGGAGLQGVHLSDAGELVAGAAGDRQGGALGERARTRALW